jgi:hypothetical protein
VCSECVVKLKGKGAPVFLTEHHVMKAYCESGGIAPLSLTSAVDGVECSDSYSGCFSPGNEPLIPI